MRKAKLLLNTLILSVLAIGGGIFVDSLTAQSRASADDFDLSENYVIIVNHNQIYGVTYNTKTQSGMRPSLIENGDGSAAYLIPISEEPTQVVITPGHNTETDVVYGVKQIQDQDGKSYAAYPAKSVLSATDLADGKCFTVTSDEMSNIRTGRMVITVDDPTNLKIQCKTDIYSLNANIAGFKDNKLVISYDPATEFRWMIYQSNAKEVFKVTLDGEKLVRTTQYLKLNPSENLYSSVPLHNLDLKDMDGTHDVAITVNFPDIQIPLKFEFENLGGNETNPEMLASMIESVSVNGTKLTDNSWLNEDFTVPNGSSVYVTPKTQVLSFWMFDSAYLNGVKLATLLQSFMVEGEDDTPYTFRMTGKLNNYWRYTLNLPDLDHLTIQVNDNLETIEASPYHGTAGLTPPVIKPVGKNGYKVYDVQVDGETIPLDENGGYTVTKMDEEITIIPKMYERTIPLQIYCDYGNYSNYYIHLDPVGQMVTRVDLSKGQQTIMINPDDLPFELGIADSYVYVNDQLLTEKDEHGLLVGLKGLGADDRVSIFTTKPRTSTIVHKEFPAGVSADIYHNGVKLDGPGVYTILPGTSVKYVPTSGTGLVLENINFTSSSFVEANSDGNFEFSAIYGGTYSLHPANSKVTVTVEGDDYRFFHAEVGEYRYAFTEPTQELIMPYTGSADATYSIKFSTEKNNVKITSVTATPSAGFSYNENTVTASGVKDGMKLTVSSEKYDKQYAVDFYCNLPPGVELAEGSDPKWPSYTFEGNDINLNPPVSITLQKTDAQEWALSFPIYFGHTNVDLWKELFDSDYFEGITEIDFPVTLDFSSLKSNFENIGSRYYDVKININGVDYDLESLKTEVNTEWGSTQTAYIVTIEDPQDIRGTISVYENSYSGYYGSRELDFEGGNIMYRYNNGEVKTSGSQPISVLPGSRLEVWLESGRAMTKCVLENHVDLYGNTETTTLQPDENNHYIIDLPGYEDFAGFDDSGYFISGNFTLVTEQPKMQLTVSSTGSAGNLSVGGSVVSGGNGTVNVNYNNYAVIKCVSDGWRVVEVLDKNTGLPMNFDIRSGKVTGIDNGMSIEVKTEKYVRDKTFKVSFYGDAPTGTQIILAPGSTMSKSITLTSNSALQTVNYHPDDLPLRSNVYYGYYASTYPVVIINNEIVTSLGDGEFDFPASFPENTVIRFYKDASKATINNVSYIIEDGIDINVTHDGVAVTDLSSTQRLATGVDIKFAEKPENKFDYEILQGSTKLTGSSVKLSNANTTFTIRKTYNTLTLNSVGDTDLSVLRFSDTEGITYAVEDGNTLKVPTRVKSLTVSPTVEDVYFADASVSGGSMKFNKDSGVLSDITSGTLSLTTATVNRDKEVTVYMENSEKLADAKITLGNGKVFETNVSLKGGTQTVSFSEEDLPLIFKLPESYLSDGETSVDPSSLPAVFVNDRLLEYSEQPGGYVFPTETFSDPANPPSVKIYSSEPSLSEITYLVEPGITFSAVADNNANKTVTEASAVELLPGTEVAISATATKSDEIIFIEIDGETIMEGSDLDYIFTVGSSAQTIEIKRKKVSLTVKCDEEWNTVRVDGAGFSYPMYAAESELEFPVGTTQVSVRTTNETRHVVKVINAADDSELAFDAATGVVNGIADKMQISLVMGDYVRDRELTLYLEEADEEAPAAALILARGKAAEKEVSLQSGYQEIMFADTDLPLAVKPVGNTESPLVVYVNNVELEYTPETGYGFPSELAENPVVKIYAESQPAISVEYEIKAPAYDVTITHDRHTVVDNNKRHSVLPGTEISFRLNPRTAPQFYTLSRAAAEGPSVTVNDEQLTPDDNGVYTIKVTREHAASGIRVAVSQGDASTGIDEVLGDKRVVDVYDLSGRSVLKNASRRDIDKLPAGVYIIGGHKVMLDR